MRKSLPSLFLICSACASAPVRLPGEARGPDLPNGHREIVVGVSALGTSMLVHLIETPDTVFGELVLTGRGMVDESGETFMARELEQLVRKDGCGKIIWRNHEFACRFVFVESVNWRAVFDRIDALDPWTLPDPGPLLERVDSIAAAVAAEKPPVPPPGGWDSGWRGPVRSLRTESLGRPGVRIVLDGTGVDVETWVEGRQGVADWHLSYLNDLPEYRDRVLGMMHVVNELRTRVPRSDVRPDGSR